MTYIKKFIKRTLPSSSLVHLIKFEISCSRFLCLSKFIDIFAPYLVLNLLIIQVVLKMITWYKACMFQEHKIGSTNFR